MSTVFLLTTGSYSDYRVLAAFSTREKAEEFQSLIGADDIEEYDLDPPALRYPESFAPYYIQMTRSGDCEEGPNPCTPIAPGTMKLRTIELHGGWSYTHKTSVLHGVVIARSAEHAIKITNDIRRQLIAENRFPEHSGDWSIAMHQQIPKRAAEIAGSLDVPL